MMNRKRCISTVFVILFFLCFIGRVKAEGNTPEDYLTFPVLVELENNQAASGFYIVKNKAVFFITAKHVFLEEDKKNNTFVLTGNTAVLKSCSQGINLTSNKQIALDLNKLYSKGYIIYNKSSDVVAVKIANFINGMEFEGVEGVTIYQSEGPFSIMPMDNIKKYEEVPIGSEVLVFGYPSSIDIRDVPQIDFSKPLIRKGIVAGKNEKTRAIILDCPIDFGNSGSPVIESEIVYKNNNCVTKYTPIGLITGFVPFIEETVNTRYRFRNFRIDNSGYSIVVPIDTVFELIQEDENLKKGKVDNKR